jgi:hypothetical protein
MTNKEELELNYLVAKEKNNNYLIYLIALTLVVSPCLVCSVAWGIIAIIGALTGQI